MKPRPVTAVHVDIARFVLEVSALSADSKESTDKMIADWTRGLARCLALRDPSLHLYGAHLLTEVEEYRKAEIERKKAKFSAPSKDSAESADSLPRSKQSKAKQSIKEGSDISRDPWFLVPEFLEAWTGWVEMRKAKKAKPTARAETLALSTLRGLAGDDSALAAKLLNQSTEHNWTGIFPLKENHGQAQNPGRGQRPAFATSEGARNRRDAKADREFADDLRL